MPKIDSVSWGKVRIDGKDYWQVLIIDGKVIPRDVEKVKEKYGTDHVVADWEKELLLSDSPEVILIATGWSGALKISQKLKVKSQKLRIELKVVLTPKIVKAYNDLVAAGKQSQRPHPRYLLNSNLLILLGYLEIQISAAASRQGWH